MEEELQEYYRSIGSIPTLSFPKKVKVYGSKYQSRLDSFETLMNKESFANTLFIFNDNEQDHSTFRRGGGNAMMRVYNRHNASLRVPRSHGIPTGTSNGGYGRLSEGKAAIDSAFHELMDLLLHGDYDSLMYSVQEEGRPFLGQSIFSISQDVVNYITLNLLLLGNKFYSIKNGGIVGDGVVIDSSFLIDTFISRK